MISLNKKATHKNHLQELRTKWKLLAEETCKSTSHQHLQYIVHTYLNSKQNCSCFALINQLITN